jgi:quinoprotein glucose dehydrogenase
LIPPPVNEASVQAQYGGNNRLVGPPYPPGAEAPSERLYSGYGLNWPYIIGPPWSSIVAYDLNSGTIKWKLPLGEDQEAVKVGGKNTGVLQGGEHHGMVVTSTGLVFANARDGKLRAFDADNGKVLWTMNVPAGTQGIPAMYEANGRQYLVIPASGPMSAGRPAGGGGFGGTPLPPGVQRAYIAYALPK